MAHDDSPRWHPLQSAQEGPVGTFRLIDTLGRQTALIELRRVDGILRYRVSTVDGIIGYADTLRLAVERGYDAYLRSLGPQGANGTAYSRPASR